MQLDAMQETILLLGKITSPRNHVQFNEESYMKLDGCENPVDTSVELLSYPIHQQVNRIEHKQLILPNINIGLQGSKYPGEVGNKAFFIRC